MIRKTLVVTAACINSLVAAHLFQDHFYYLQLSSGASMLPTVNMSRDYLLVDCKYKYNRDRSLKTGDIVVVHKPTDPVQKVCKRIIGLEGDLILVDPSKNSLLCKLEKYLQEENIDISDIIYENKSSLNGFENRVDALNDALSKFRNSKLKETILKNKLLRRYDQSFDNEYIEIPKSHCWLTGDDLNNSTDSRTYLVVPYGLINGKVIGKLYVGNTLNPFTWKYSSVESNYQDV